METDEIIDKLDEYGVPCGPIQNIEQVMTSPQVIARNMMADIEHPNIPDLKVPAFPVKFSGTPIVVQSLPPLLGQHIKEVLTELGYSEEVIKNFKNKKSFKVKSTPKFIKRTKNPNQYPFKIKAPYSLVVFGQVVDREFFVIELLGLQHCSHRL